MDAWVKTVAAQASDIWCRYIVLHLAIYLLKVPSLEKEMLRLAGAICRRTVRTSMQMRHIPS